jgi:heme/copper-type cytochrome/quinol oxidase subunit 2
MGERGMDMTYPKKNKDEENIVLSVLAATVIFILAIVLLIYCS